MPFCRKCGTEYYEGEEYCSHCYAALESPADGGREDEAYHRKEVVEDIVDYREGKTTHLYDDGTYDEEYSRSSCFIATAAFGTPLAREIDSLRTFRDEKLVPNQLGRALVSTYYLISPTIAYAVARTTPLRIVVRALVRCVVAHVSEN